MLLPVSLAPLLSEAAQGDQAGLETALKKQVREAPRSFQANSSLGEFYLHNQKFSAAVTYLKAAHALNPADYNNGFDLAQAELQASNAAGAIQVVRELLRVNDRAELHNLLGDCEDAAGNPREALSEYQIAAKADPTEQNLFSFGSALVKYQNFREARQIFRYGAEHFASWARICVGLGVAQYSLGEYRNAVETFCRAVDLDPKDTRALEFLGKMVGVSPELDEEVGSRLKHFVAAYPNNSAANYYYALSLLNIVGDKQSAKTFFARAVSLNPSLADGHYQLAQLLEEEGQLEKAIEQYQAALKYQPKLSAAHYRLARIYQKQGRAVLAQREYDAVKSLSPK